MNAERLRQLRLAKGLSLEELAACMGGMITKQSLSKYELGKAQPSPSVLVRLAEALGVKAAYLAGEPELRVEYVAYRKSSALPKGKQLQVQALVARGLEARVRLQELVGYAPQAPLPIQSLDVESLADVEQAACWLRCEWGLGREPVASVVDTLERHFVHVIELEAPEGFDGISAVARDAEGSLRAAAVVCRRGLPAERQRLSLAHELGHLTLRPAAELAPEKAAFRFAGAFLAPAELLYREVGTHRASIQVLELLLLKRLLGLSMQAILHRLCDLGIISDTYYTSWCKDISRLGWRRREPEEHDPERPQWAYQAVLRALSEGLVSEEEAEVLSGEPTGVKASAPALTERRTLMGLPLAERRRILARQAEAMSGYYASLDANWDLETGDIAD